MINSTLGASAHVYDDVQMELQLAMLLGLLIVLFLPDAGSLELSRERFAEPVKLLPIAFVSSLIVGLWSIYTFFHCYEPGHGHYCLIWIFNLSTSLLVICYLKCIFVHPGTIPDKEEDPSWIHTVADGSEGYDLVLAERAGMSAGLGVVLHEKKRSGDRRSCKWCSKYKPDRCHHCRVCRMCILKMDHHCPWIYNCVGYKNHKYFFLLLFYSVIDCHIIAWTMYPSVGRAVDNPSTPFLSMFFLLFGQTLACFIGLLVTAFFTFHIWLMLKSMTTIEFCEKSMKKMGYESSVYDRGVYGNIKAVLGDCMLLWLLPISPPAGRGLVFATEDSRLLPAAATGDVESGGAAAFSALPVSTLTAQPKSPPSSGDSGTRARQRHRAGTGAAPDSSNPPTSEDSDDKESHQAPQFQGDLIASQAHRVSDLVARD
jgi:hypothetical protein